MIWRPERHWRCKECYWIGPEHAILKAANPFDAEATLYGCPQCKEVDSVESMCDVEGCKQTAGCGTPTPEGYRLTCGPHKPAETEVTGRRTTRPLPTIFNNGDKHERTDDDE